MDPNHDWKLRFIVMTSRTCDVQVKALELILLKHLSWDVALGETDEFLLKTFLVSLWTYWAETIASACRRKQTSRIGDSPVASCID